MQGYSTVCFLGTAVKPPSVHKALCTLLSKDLIFLVSESMPHGKCQTHDSNIFNDV